MSSIDWDFWLHMPAVTVWQACALSLEIDPDKMNKIQDAWMEPSRPLFKDESFRSAEEKEIFEKRLRLLSKSIYTEYFRLYKETGYAAYSEIYLKDLAKWAVSVVNWDNLPPEFLKLAGEPDTVTVKPLKDKPKPFANSTKSVRGRPKEIDTKVTILRKLIATMLGEKKIDPFALPGSASDLLGACQRIEKIITETDEIKVFDTSEDTFKDWLKATGYRFKVGRTPNDEMVYWTNLCVKTMGEMKKEFFI